MKIKISAGLQAVLPTGAYQNMRPSFTAEIETEIDDKTPIDPSIEGLQKRCYAICERMVDEAAAKAKVEKIKAAMANFHWIKMPDGREAPSVTSILSIEGDFFDIPPDDLRQFAAQGNIIDGMAKHFIATGKWVPAKEIDDLWADIVVCDRGALQLPVAGWDFPGFLAKYPIKDMRVGKTSYNVKHFYGGTPDFTGIPVGWNKIKGFEEVREVRTMFDVKRTKAVVKNGKQMAAYANMFGYEDCEQLCVVELNDKTAQGFSKPEFYSADKKEGYFKMFLRDRAAFYKLYDL